MNFKVTLDQTRQMSTNLLKITLSKVTCNNCQYKLNQKVWSLEGDLCVIGSAGKQNNADKILGIKEKRQVFSEEKSSVLGGGRIDTNAREASRDEVLLYDVNASIDDKFAYSLLFNGDYKNAIQCDSDITCRFKMQSKYMFGFIRLSDPLMPSNLQSNVSDVSSIVELHETIKCYGKPNFLGARIPVSSQLRIQNWKVLLKDYWDQQLLQFLEYGSP